MASPHSSGLAIIDDLNKNHGITVVLITHHMNEAVSADRIIVMDAGKIVMEGTPREIFPNVEKLRDLNLTVPQTVELISKLNENGFSIPLDNITVDECVDAIIRSLN